MNQSTLLGERAIVGGGSLAGLLTARVLADYFEHVLVLDRDKVGDMPEYRAMTPHTRHAHILLKGGELAIERLLPGFSDDMVALGSVPMNAGRAFLAGNDLGFVPRWDAPFVMLGQSRATLEHYVRQRVRTYSPRIVLQDETPVRGLLASPGRQAVVGATVERADGSTEELDADLVVDASGRGAGATRWLAALGLPTPDVETVKVDFGYSSCMFRLREDTGRD